MAEKNGAGGEKQAYNEQDGRYTKDGGNSGNKDRETSNNKLKDAIRKYSDAPARDMREMGVSANKDEPQIPRNISHFCNELSDEQIQKSGGWLSQLGQEDMVLKQMITMRGFDGKPRVVQAKQIDKMVMDGSMGFTRGMKVDFGAEQYKSGDMFVGRGVHGHGVYVSGHTAENKERAMIEAQKYATHNGSIVTGVIDRSAKFVTKTALNSIREKLSTTWTEKEKKLFHDNGKLAVALGYDVIDCENELYYIVLNRQKTIVGE